VHNEFGISEDVRNDWCMKIGLCRLVKIAVVHVKKSLQ